MPYQGAALVFLLGVGLATAAIMYLLREHERQQQPHSYSDHTPPCDNEYPRNSWSRNTEHPNNGRRRRRSQSNGPQICSICQDYMHTGGPRYKTLPCHHTFHSTCIDEWARVRRDCPHCRSAF